MSYEDFVARVEKSMLDLDDLHTRMIFAGKSLPDYETELVPDEGSKTDIYFDAKEKYGCYEREEEFVVSYQDGKVFVELNRFSSKISYVVNRLQDESKNTEIVFDLTCNPGGYVGSVMHLLSVLTREPMVFSTYIPQDNRYVYKTYDTPVERAIDGKYTFYVSPVTYSAANLLISLVQDMEIGTVIGTKTSGGAASVHYGVLPGGIIISYSSYRTIVDDDGLIIEAGIEPDIEYTEVFDINNLYIELEKE